MPLKQVNDVNLIYTNPTLEMDILHNLHGQLSQYHELIFSLNVDRDGRSLIYVGTMFHNWGKSSYQQSHVIL